MKSTPVAIGDTAQAEQYNKLRDDAYGGSMLLPHQQSSPNMTLKIEAGVVFVGATRVIYAGGNTPSFSAPSSNPRIDIVTIDSAGTIAITQGTEAASPVAPSYPFNKLVICEVYNRVGETSIKTTDDASNGYIYNDVRGYLGFSYISNSSQVDATLFVKLAGSVDETITGVKTFGSFPVTPGSNPGGNYDVANKQYVDNKLGALFNAGLCTKLDVTLSNNMDTNYDETFSIGFQPRFIVLFYFIRGVSSGINSYSKGIALFSGTSLVADNITHQARNSRHAGSSYPYIPFSNPSTDWPLKPDESAAPITAGDLNPSFYSSDWRLDLTISSVSASGFVLRKRVRAQSSVSGSANDVFHGWYMAYA